MARTVDPEKGIRSYAANAYYAPVSQRRNLVLLTDAQVTKINFHQRNPKTGKITATGIEFVSGNKTYSARASKEIVLAAGMSSLRFGVLPCVSDYPPRFYSDTSNSGAFWNREQRYIDQIWHQNSASYARSGRKSPGMYLLRMTMEPNLSIRI
jgi:hypothetical protein